MFALYLSDGIKTDIRNILALDPDAGSDILVVLQELESGNQALLDSLTDHEYSGQFPSTGLAYNVKHWWEHFRKGKNLWRLRILNSSTLHAYRIVYGYSQTEQAYYILGAVSRDFNYDPNHSISRRMLAEYENLCNW